MIKQAYKFECDRCYAEAYYVGENLEEAKAEARADGWKMHGKRGCFCGENCYVEAIA